MNHVVQLTEVPVVMDHSSTWQCLQLGWRHWLAPESRVLQLGGDVQLGRGLAAMGHRVDATDTPVVSADQLVELPLGGCYDLLLTSLPNALSRPLFQCLDRFPSLLTANGLVVQMCSCSSSQIVVGLKAGWHLKARYEDACCSVLVWRRECASH